MAKATTDGRVIIVDTTWAEKELIKQVPGTRWSANDRTWTCPLTWTSCIVLRGVFGEALEVSPELTEWAWPVAIEAHERVAMRSLLEPETRRRTDLFPFQEVGAIFLHRTVETLLADEMGTGKTVQACAALNDAHLRSLEGAPSPLPAIVICPNSVKRSWAEHIEKWTDAATPYVITGGAAQRAKILKIAAADPYAVVIVNYDALRGMTRLAPYGSIRLRRCQSCDKKNGEEGLSPTKCQVHPSILNTIPFKTVIIDEAHKIKSPSAQQTRAVWGVAHQDSVRFRWALTGTPIANHPGDLWSVLHAIAPDSFPTKTHYVDRYCLQSWNPTGGLDIVGLNPAAREEFFALLDPRFRRVRKDVVLQQLPPKIRSSRWVEMTPKQRKMYDNFDVSLAVETDSGEVIVASSNLTARLRQLQLSSATVDVTDDGIRMMEPAHKLDALEDILEELGEKQVAVCAMHRQLIDLAAARLLKRGISFGLITGNVSEYDRDKALRDFQEGRVRVLLFTVAAGGTGLTMTAADTLVFLQRSWSMIDNLQAEDRVHRIGSEKHESVHIIDIITRDSVEEDQVKRLHEKLERLREITRDRASATGTDAYDREEEAIMGSQLW